MINEKIHIDEALAFPYAEQRFIQTCGFDLNKPKHQRMMKMGLKVREDGLDGININGLVSFYGPEVFKDGAVHIGDTEIKCNYFERIPADAVEGIYFYALTVGECYFSSEENIMDFLYADIWGSTYVVSGIDILTDDYILADMKKRFGDKKVYLSEEFGPGYFGMPVSETKNFFKILDADKINIKIKDSGLMIPQKTCAGFYMVYNRDDLKAEPECLRCLGNKSGCQFCEVRAKMMDEVKR